MMRRIMLAAAALAVLGCCSAQAAPVFFDGFEPSINGSIWELGPWSAPQAHEELKGADNHIRTPGINGPRIWVNYRVTYNSQHYLGQYYDNYYLKVWMFEDNDIPFPGYTAEAMPNAQISLLDTAVAGEAFHIGVMAEYGRIATPYTRTWFDHCAVETTTDGPVVLNGSNGTVKTLRKQGWRKYTILVHPYTGAAGDVKFLIDDKVVYNGKRVYNPNTAVPVDTIVLGNRWWSQETYWYDHVDFGTIDTLVECDTIADAAGQADGTWVRVQNKVVTGAFNKSPWPGMLTIAESDGSSAIWVSSSYAAAVNAATEMGEQVTVRGIMTTNLAGVRVLDAIEITSTAASTPMPEEVGTAQKGLGLKPIEGRLVKVWGEVTGKGQERNGDWRRYVLIDDGSSNAPVKAYYDNIISGTDPVPNVNAGDYISVVGSAYRDVLIEGGAIEESVWIRGTGDLDIIVDAP